MLLDLTTVPTTPGVYQWFDSEVEGSVLYVGKAKDLRKRLTSYFRPSKSLHPRTRAMVASAKRVEWIELTTEAEALLLEAALIAKLQPPYNVKLKDERELPWIALDSRPRQGESESWPRLTLWYGPAKKGVRRFGPYLDRSTAVRILEIATHVWPLRSCTQKTFRFQQVKGRPCFLGLIDRCSAPCTRGDQASVFLGKAPTDFEETYEELVQGVTELLSGNIKPSIEKLTVQMKQAAAAQYFEQAAKIRDRLSYITKLTEQQGVALDTEADFDLFAVATGSEHAAVQVFQVRAGRLTGAPTFTTTDEEDILSTTLRSFYLSSDNCPPTVIVEELPSDSEVIAEAISQHCGRKVHIETRQQGVRKQLLDRATLNAQSALHRAMRRRAEDQVARMNNLEMLKEMIGLPKLPRRIEAVDISHLGGIGTVSVISVLIEGVAKTSEYRNYRLSDIGHPDDIYSMHEVLSRRLRRAKDQIKAGQKDKIPDLLLIDGGPTQLAAAIDELKKADLFDVIPVASLAKREELVFRPGEAEPVHIPHDSPALYILQLARDETHRAGNVYQKKLRNQTLLNSELDNIEGLGKTRRARLIKETGGVTKLRSWNDEQWDTLTWLPQSVRKTLRRKLTGEIT